MASGKMSGDGFRKFLNETLGAAAAVSRPGAVHFVCMDWRHLDDVSAVGRQVYDDLLNLCVWNKSNAGMGSLYRSKHEIVFVFRVGDAPHSNMVELGRHGRNRTNMWDYPSVNSMAGNRREDLALHPTGQTRCHGHRCLSGCDQARRSGVRHVPRVGHVADRCRANRETVPWL